MPLLTEQELKEAVERVNDDLQSIQDTVGRDFNRRCKVRFPRGYIRTAEHFRSQFAFIEDSTLRDNLSYAFMLHDVQHWMLVRTDLSGIAAEMLIKDSIVLLGNIAETLSKVPLSATAQKKSFSDRVTKLQSMGMISAALRDELGWLWDSRCKCHLFLVTLREYGHYKISDYNRAVKTLRAFRDALQNHLS